MALSGSLEYEHSLSGTLQEPTSLSGELSLPIVNEGNTTDYNALYNKPTINGVELKGNLTLEDLGIVVNAVKDILINGASIIDKDGNAIIPVATSKNLGLVKVNTNANRPVYIDGNGLLQVGLASGSDLDKRNAQKVIGCGSYDGMVKRAMCDGVGVEWTSQEKAMARNRMGLEWHLIDTVEASDVAQVEIIFPQEYDEFMIIADISGNGNLIIHPHTCYNVSDNGVIQARQMLHSAYYPSDKTEHLELTFEKAYIDNDIYFRISGYEKTDYAWNLNKNIQTTGWAQAYDIANTKPCFAWYMVKFQRTITNATFKIYAR